VSAVDLPAVLVLTRGCVCCWPTCCPGTKERLCMLLGSISGGPVQIFLAEIHRYISFIK
jgi:hypothetical protein